MRRLGFLLVFLCMWLLPATAQVTADFTQSAVQGCSPLVVNFTNQSTGSPTSYQWFFGNGNVSFQASPGAVYLSPGIYTVTLVASNATSSDTITKSNLVTVFRNPVAIYVGDSLMGCIPHTVNFTDGSEDGDLPIVSWQWDFGDGNSSNQPSPSHTYTNPGVYDITLVVIDGNGCSNKLVRNGYMDILPVPVASFNSSNPVACSAPHTVNFTNTSTTSGGVTHIWDFGNGQTSTQANPSVTYNASGSYNVELTVTDASGCSSTRTENGWVSIGNLSAFFLPGQTSGCVGEVFSFTDITTPSPTSWSWNFGDGNTSNQQNPTHAYSTPGTYTVTLTATDGAGCTSTYSVPNITVTAAPNVDFVADVPNGCELPHTVNFTDLSTGGGGVTSWFWDFGDGTTSTQQNPTHNYTANGQYTVTLTARNANGCTVVETKMNYISIVAPQANFTADVRDGCVDLTVNFTDLSTSVQPIVSWQWIFGDGNTSGASNPTNVYTSRGEFDVTLIVTNSLGCSDTLTRPQYIEVGDTPVVNFSATPRATCLQNPVSFTDLSTPADEWWWAFGDGGTSTNQDPVYQYGDTGVFTVTHVAIDNGCSDTIVFVNYITIYPPEAEFQVNYNCIDPYTVTFDDLSIAPDLWFWDFGDGDTSVIPEPTHTYDSTGDYTVTLTVWDTVGGCFDSRSRTIRIRDPEADFTVLDSSGCAPFRTRFFNNSTDDDSRTWYLGTGATRTWNNPWYTYQNPGIYDVTLIIEDIHGCEDTINAPGLITVYRATAAFVADSVRGCAPLFVNYADSSTSFLGSIISWNWEFGNGDTSAQQNPSTFYPSPGNYTVSLAVTDDNGCADTLIRTNYIQPTYPTPDFVVDDSVACIGQSLQFTDLSIGNGLTYLWDFGDGTTSTASNPTHAYADTGSYTITLSLIDINNCDSTVVKPFYIDIVKPRIQIAIDTLYGRCPPTFISFTDFTVVGDSVTDWLWDFGDNQTSDIQNPSHAYTTVDSFYPSLIVTDVQGCTDTFLNPDPIVVDGPAGSFDFIQTTFCIPLDVLFFSDAGDSVIHIWDFGDGTVFPGTDSIIHSYVDPGDFRPKLILDDGKGCIVSLDSPDSIYAATMDGNYISDRRYLCEPGTVNFFDLSTGQPAVVSWFWDFGDGDTSTQRNPSHYYGAPGNYTVTQITQNAVGCNDTVRRPYITVSLGTVADFNPTDSILCAPGTVTFNDASTSDTTIVDWQWSLGNGSTSTAQNPTTTYDSAGTYTVDLVVTMIMGCVDSVTKTIRIDPIPTATADMDTSICIGNTVTLNAIGGSSYDWSPSASLNDATLQSPLATPSATTIYGVTVTDANGCTNTDSMEVVVDPLPNPAITGQDSICLGESAPMTATGGVTYSWSPAGDLNNSGIANPVATPVNTTTYTVTVTDANGCVNTDDFVVTVNPLPVPTITPNDSICVGESFQLNATGGVSYLWNPAASLNNATIANPVASPTNTTTYTVTVTDGNGCSATTAMDLTVNPLPAPVLSPDVSICIGDTTQLNASGGLNYQWSPATALSCANCADPFASPTVQTTYSVLITDANGCTNTDSLVVSVNPLPTANITAPAQICIGESAPMTATGGVSYTWSPAGDLNNSGISNPIATPASTTTFTVTVTDVNGCVNTDDHTITVNPLPVPTITPNDSICFGESFQLNAAGGVTYAWSPASTLNNANIADPVASPGLPTTYTVTVTDANGCSATASMDLDVNPLPMPVLSPDVSICIGDTTQLNVSGGVDYNWTPSSGLSCTTCADPMASPLTTTTYTAGVTNIHGCTRFDSLTVTIMPLPVVTTSPDTGVCFGASAQLLATGGATYSWIPSSSLNDATLANPIATPSSNTTYIVEVATAFGCLAYDTVEVTVFQFNADFLRSDTAICVPGTINFSDISTSDSTIISWDWDLGPSTATTQNASYNYTQAADHDISLIITTVNGCVDTMVKPVTIHPLPIANAGPDSTICIYDTIQLSASGGMAYEWLYPIELDSSLVNDPNVYPSDTTIYTVLVTDSNGCQNMDSLTVFVNPLPVVITSLDDSICFGESITISAGGGESYLWTPSASLDNDTIQQPLATPDSSTTYVVLVTDSNGCQNAGQTLVRVDPLPITNVRALNFQLCFGFSTPIIASGGVDYQWQNPQDGLSCGSCADPIATPTQTTTYYVDITNQFGCIVTDSVTITVNELPQGIATNDTIICRDDSVTIEAIGGTVYAWSPANTLSCDSCANPIAHPLVTTEYTVHITNQFGCSNRDTVLVEVSQFQAAFSMSDSAICLPGTINFNDLSISDTTVKNWFWNFDGTSFDVSQNTSFTYTQAGTYNVTLGIQTALGCTDNASRQLVVYPKPDVDAGPDRTLCLGSGFIMNASTNASTFWWTPTTGLNVSGSLTPFAAPLSSTDYILSVEDTNGCVNSDTIAVTVNPVPIIDVTNNSTICKGDSVSLSASGNYSFSWIPAINLSHADSSTTWAKPDDTFTYVLEALNQFNCRTFDTVTVTVNPIPDAPITAPLEICEGESVRLESFGPSTDDFNWSPASLTSCSTCQQTWAFPTETTTFRLDVENQFGCSNWDTATVAVRPNPWVETPLNIIVCKGEEVEFPAEASADAIIFEWSPATDINDATILNPIGSPAKTSEYAITVTNEFGCTDSDTLSFIIKEKVQAFGAADTGVCDGVQVQLFAAFNDGSILGNSSVTWYPQEAFEDPTSWSPILLPEEDQPYFAVVEDGSCAPDTVRIYVEVFDLPTVDLGPDQTTYDGVDLPLTAFSTDPIVNYVWSPDDMLSCNDCETTEFRAITSQTFNVTVTDINGCQANDSINVKVITTCSQEIFLPNTFTPNGDGVNDEFFVRGSEALWDINVFRVFDRWGTLIFETNTKTIGWDGTYKGQPVEIGAYVYYVESLCTSGELVKQKGNVTVIR